MPAWILEGKLIPEVRQNLLQERPYPFLGYSVLLKLIGTSGLGPQLDTQLSILKTPIYNQQNLFTRESMASLTCDTIPSTTLCLVSNTSTGERKRFKMDFIQPAA